MATRFGVDVGGTFTDLVFYDDVSGQTAVDKRPTTPGRFAEGVASVIASGVPKEELARTEFFLHGTTVGINAVLERNGATVGLLTTRGFRDVLEVRRGDRGAMLDILAEPPAPLVPRRLRLPVTERTRPDGTVDTPLDENDVRSALEIFARERVNAIAVVYLHAYANPEHESATYRILREAGFDGAISLSHRISREFREYERTSTTVVDAYVRPAFADYLDDLDSRLSALAFDGERLVARSGGGAMTFADARERPFETIISGPVGGAVGAGELATALGLNYAITADVGGTSMDTCLIVNGSPELRYEGEVDGMPLQTPWIDVRSIGAGGGSVAYVDEGGLLRVGPRSAGAVPGPVSYGKGGTEPTITDAAALLGMLGAGDLAGGLSLDIEAARDSLGGISNQMSMDTTAVASGVLTIATASMADAIRSITVERGHDPRSASLIMFGGAGGLFGTLLAQELEITEVIIPRYPGNFSAWGLLGQDITQSAALTIFEDLDPQGLQRAGEAAKTMFEGLADRDRPGDHTSQEIMDIGFDLRYAGQTHTLTVHPPNTNGVLAADVDDISRLFETAHETAYGHTLKEPVELVSVRATIRTPLPRKKAAALPSKPHPSVGSFETATAYSFASKDYAEFVLLQREELPLGFQIDGPAIVLEPTATTYLDQNFQLSVLESGELAMHTGDRTAT